MACYFIVEIYLKRQTLWKGLCFRFRGIVISFSHLNNLISCLNSFLENYSLIVSVSVLHFKWSDAYQYAYILWLVEREELHFRTDWYPTKTWNISHAQFALLFNYHSWWSRMGESSFNVYYILCDVRLYLAYLPVKSCITITIPASFLQFLTFLYAHKTCQELLDVHKASYQWVSHLSFSWIFNDTWTGSLSLQTVKVHARRAAVSSVSQKKFWTFPTPIRIFRVSTAL